MLALFKRDAGSARPGEGEVAVSARVGATVPAGCTGLAFDERGNLRRFAGDGRIAAGKEWSACIFHPGPYRLSLTPYPQAPEAGLGVRLLVDAPDPRFAQQRFDLFLAGEAGGCATVALLHDVLEDALQRALASGALFLPPCTSVDEWNAFRRGFDELVYTRTGMIVEDCLPEDVGDTVDYAAQLARHRSTVPASPVVCASPVVPAQAGTHAASDVVAQHRSPLSRGRQEPQHGSPLSRGRQDLQADARALRRLFLELPGLSARLRLALPASGVPFAAQRALLARFEHAGVLVDTMPALDLLAPGVPLPECERSLRAQASLAAQSALDDAWALLARLQARQAGDASSEAERIAARLEGALARRRATAAGSLA